jgi:hypothetical protein
MMDDEPQMKNHQRTGQRILNTNKFAPESCQDAVSLALDFFPELRTVPIRFFHQPSVIPHKSRPTTRSLFKSSNRGRVYDVVLSAKTIPEFGDLCFDKLRFREQVGLIAHELAHITQYQAYGFSDLIRSYLAYLHPDKRKAIEQEADKKVVEQGLGWELYAYANARERAAADNPVVHYLDQFHLSPEDIMHYMQNLNRSSKIDFRIDLTYHMN